MEHSHRFGSRSLLPWIVAGVVGLLLVLQLRWLVKNTSDEAKDVVDHAGQTIVDIVDSPSSMDEKIEEARGRSPEELIRAGADAAHESIKAGDSVADELLGLTIEEEIAIGKRHHEQVMSEFTPLHDPDLDQWIIELFEPIASERFRTRRMTYHVTLLDTDMVNAFSHAGGYIYMCRGMLEMLDHDPHAVQFVLGHEIAHIELGQCARRVYLATRASQIGGPMFGQLGGAAHGLLQVGYSEEDELACDEWSYRAMQKLGRSKGQRLSAARRMVSYEQTDESPHDRDEKAGILGTVVEEIEQHFCTHPPASLRLERLENVDDASSSTVG